MKTFFVRFLAFTLLLVCAFGPAIRQYNTYLFNKEVTGRLKRAADANTVDIAETEMGAVIHYLEANGITSGSTSIIWDTPNNDVGFWYNNLKAALGELESIPENATKVEKTNTLMKLRETILDNLEVTQPEFIEIYPHVIFWRLLTSGAVIGIVISIAVLAWSFLISPPRRRAY